MHRTRTLLAILAALLISGNARAEDRPEDRAPIQEIHKTIARLAAEIDLLKPYQLSLQLQDIQARLSKLEDTVARPPGHSSFYPTEPDLRTLDDARGYLRSLDDRLRVLETRLASGSDNNRINRSFSPTPLTTTGTLRLENNWIKPATFIIDGVPHSLLPFEKLDLPGRPAGPYTYDVLIDGIPVRTGQTGLVVAQRIRPLYIDPPGVYR